jgi:hypothetical protein
VDVADMVVVDVEEGTADEVIEEGHEPTAA